jgi:hypothetical protein
VTALPRAELSTAEAIAAFTSCLARRGLFSYAAAVRVSDRDAWVQQRCSAGRMLCAQLQLGFAAVVAMPEPN